MENELLVLMAVIPCFYLWETEYKPLALMFAADFVMFFAFDELWLASDLAGGEWMLPLKGLFYSMFAVLYYVLNTRTGLYLSVLSGITGFAHGVNNLLLYYGTGLTEDNYTLIMGTYCALQFLIFYGGVGYGIYIGRSPVRSSYLPHHHGGKGKW